MNVLKMLETRFADSGHQEVTATGTTIDPSKGCIKLTCGGNATVYLPRIAEAGHLPFFITATDANDYTLTDNIADGSSTYTVLNSGGIATAIVWYDGFAWRSVALTQYAANALLGTLLTRNGADGILALSDTGTVTYNDQVITLTENLGGAYNVTMPTLANTDAMPYFFAMIATGALTVTIKEAAGDGGSTIGTLTYGLDAGGIVIGDGSNYKLIKIPVYPVNGLSSATDGDFVRFDGTGGRQVKGGIALDTSISSPGSDTSIPSEKAVVTWVASAAAPIQTANAAITADATAITATQHVAIITNAAANTVVLPLASTAVGRHYCILTKVADDTAVNEHADDGGATIVTLNTGGVAKALLFCDGVDWYEIH